MLLFFLERFWSLDSFFAVLTISLSDLILWFEQKIFPPGACFCTLGHWLLLRLGRLWESLVGKAWLVGMR